MPKYTIDEIIENLINFKQKLIDKGRNDGFWVIASRSDFKPIKLQETIKGKTISKTLVSIHDIKKELLEGKEQYFKGKKISGISFYFYPNKYKNIKKYNDENFEKIKNEAICGITIDIYIVDDNGKIGIKEINKWRCSVNFTVDDLSKHKLKFTDAEVIMRQVADRLITTIGFDSIDFKDYVNILRKIKK